MGEISVTRFDEILPLGQTFKNPRQTIEGLFCVWQLLSNLGKFELSCE